MSDTGFDVLIRAAESQGDWGAVIHLIAAKHDAAMSTTTKRGSRPNGSATQSPSPGREERQA